MGGDAASRAPGPDAQAASGNAKPGGYAGDISVDESWRLLESDPSAVLVDVRTQAEWSYVGVPDLSALSRQPLLIEWQSFPSGAVNPAFGEELAGLLGPDRRDVPVLFICRSGARSKAAAIALTGQGFTRCYNISSGFEGDLDSQRHRGSRNGWKAAGLPWAQS